MVSVSQAMSTGLPVFSYSASNHVNHRLVIIDIFILADWCMVLPVCIRRTASRKSQSIGFSRKLKMLQFLGAMPCACKLLNGFEPQTKITCPFWETGGSSSNAQELIWWGGNLA